MNPDNTHGVKVGDWRAAPPAGPREQAQVVFIDGTDGDHAMAIGVVTEGPWRGCRCWRFPSFQDAASWPLVEPASFEAAIVMEWHRKVAADELTSAPVRRQSQHAVELLAGQWHAIQEREAARG